MSKTKQLAGKTLLLADDEPEILEILKDEFEYHGATVHTAGNGKEAAKVLQRERCDLVLSDVRMPGGDGISLLRELKSRDVFMPVFVFLSGYSDAAPSQAYDLGADAILAKPFDLAEVLAQVLKALRPLEEKFADSSAASTGTVDQQLAEGISLGRGGIFLKGAVLATGTVCDLRLRCPDAEPAQVDGQGLVRWNRPEETGGLPAGCGIELLRVAPEERAQLVEEIRRRKPVAFIPEK